MERTVPRGCAWALAVAVVIVAWGPSVAAAQPRCQVPAPGEWQRVSPAQAGMDGARLQRSIDRATLDLSLAVRVYRRGCLVAEDRLAPVNRTIRFESWSLAKSVAALLFGRAMTKGEISPDDTVGSLIPEASREHGSITMADLLTMTSGLHWNGLRDYNIFTMPDRVHDALTLRFDHEPGTFYEYAQSAVALLVEAVRRATGEDPERYLTREILTPLGVGPWEWGRDLSGNVLGFMGVRMRPDDFARLGELMRRDGRWGGRRLLSRQFVREAITPKPTNGCYGWLIWTNRGRPCVGPTIVDRPVSSSRQFPGLPPDLYRFSGLFGQVVAVFPSQDLVIVRTGLDTFVNFTGSSYERELYDGVLASIVDEPVRTSGDGRETSMSQPDTDYGFQTALLNPGEYSQGVVQDPLPAAGPARARAARIGPERVRTSRAGRVGVRLICPRRWPASGLGACRGELRVAGGPATRYRVRAGRRQTLRVALPRPVRKRLASGQRVTRPAIARNRDRAGGVRTRRAIVIRPRR